MRRRFGTFFQQPVSQAISPALQRAHEMMSMGEYARAAMSFEQLGHTAEMRERQRAPFLFFQAGRARILLNQPAPAMSHFRHGLDLLIQAKRYNQLYRAGQRIAQELRLRGLEKESREIAALVGASIPAIAELPTERGPDMTAVVLPTYCDSCGGPIRSPEVEWLDAHTAECPYCGNPIRA